MSALLEALTLRQGQPITHRTGRSSSGPAIGNVTGFSSLALPPGRCILVERVTCLWAAAVAADTGLASWRFNLGNSATPTLGPIFAGRVPGVIGATAALGPRYETENNVNLLVLLTTDLVISGSASFNAAITAAGGQLMFETVWWDLGSSGQFARIFQSLNDVG